MYSITVFLTYTGAHIPQHTPTSEDPPSGNNDSGAEDDSVATTVGFVVILFVLVLAILMTVLLCVRHGMCSCQNNKPPPPNHAAVTPASRMTGGNATRTNRSPLVSTSSVRSSQRGGHSTHSPNSHHYHHSHHHHQNSHHHHHHSSSSHSPRRHNGHVGGPTIDRVANGTNSGTSIGDSSGFSQHHHNMRSASMDPPLTSNISPYPGMPIPYQPCKSPMMPYGNSGVGYSVHPQIPRTPTSASITTLSSLSTSHNHRGGMSNGGIGGRERGGSGRERMNGVVAVGGSSREEGDGRLTGEEEEGGGGGGQDTLRNWRGGRDRGVGSDDQRRDRGGERRGDEVRAGESGTSRSGGETRRYPMSQRQVEGSNDTNSHSSPLQFYSTQV